MGFPENAIFLLWTYLPDIRNLQDCRSNYNVWNKDFVINLRPVTRIP